MAGRTFKEVVGNDAFKEEHVDEYLQFINKSSDPDYDTATLQRIRLDAFSGDIATFVRELTGLLENLIIDASKIPSDSATQNKEDTFRRTRRNNFINSKYSEVHRALFDLSDKYDHVYLGGVKNYGFRVTYKGRPNTGVSLITGHLDMLEFAYLRGN